MAFLMYFLVFGAVITLIWLLIDKRRRQKALQQHLLNLVMLEVKVPKESSKTEDEPLKGYRDYVGVGEQLLSTFATFFDNRLAALWYGQPVFSFEIITRDNQIFFMVGTPRHFREVVEKQILSFYPTAQIEPSTDFRLFDKKHHGAVGTLDLARQFIYPLKTYQELEFDPLNNLTNSLSKLGPDTNGGIQFLIRPHRGSWRAAIGHALSQLKAGKSVSGARSALVRGLHSAANVTTQPKDSTQPLSPMQEEQIKLVQRKGEKVGFECQIRIAVTAPTMAKAKEDVRNIFASFAQFGSPDRNSLRLIFPRHPRKILPFYVMRHFARHHIMILNAEELATIFHFPNYLVETPGVRWFMSKVAPPPSNVPSEGIVLGENLYRGIKTTIRLGEDDRRRHLYAIGMTGTGKSTFFESMILQDIRAGRGLAFFDPHGEAVENILARFPKERIDDVVIFDPSDVERPFGLNLLEWRTPEQKDFLVQEAVQIFYKLFDPNSQGFVGPQFEHWMRNAALTLMESPEGGTLIEIPRLFVDEEFRKQKIATVKDPVVKAFWEKQLSQTADFHKSEMYNYFISKFGRFMTNATMRNIMGQAKSSFDLRDMMDNRKVLLVNLSKGKIGEINSNLLGMILVARMFTAALSRQEVELEKRSDFYLYVDEFQNFATDTFSSILSEARKYRLNLNITNQYVAQLPETIRDAIIGNVGSLVSFRIGAPDAEFLAPQFEPVFSEKDLINIDAFNCCVKLLVSNAPTKPFSMKTIRDEVAASADQATQIKELSRSRYGRERGIVEKEVETRTKTLAAVTPPGIATREG